MKTQSQTLPPPHRRNHCRNHRRNQHFRDSILRSMRLSFVLFGIVVAAAGINAAVASERAPMGMAAKDRTNEDAVLKSILLVQRISGNPVRIYYAGVCASDDGSDYVVPFPRLVLRPSTRKKRVLDAIREVLRDSRDARVVRDSSGIVRITVGSVPVEVLRTPISKLTFEPKAQHNPDVALDAIANNSDVQAAMRRLSLSMPTKIINRIVGAPAENSPRLPGSMSNVTMDQALDSVAGKFHGIVLYGICANQHSFSLEFIGRDMMSEQKHASGR